MIVDLEVLEIMYDKLEDTYSSLVDILRRLEKIDSEIWNYMDIECTYLLQKHMQEIIESVYEEKKYTECLMQALEEVMRCYLDAERELLENLGTYTENVDYEQVEYHRLDEVQKIIKELF